MPLRMGTYFEVRNKTQTDLQTQVNSCNATNRVILADEKVVYRPTQLFYIWIFICCVNIQI